MQIELIKTIHLKPYDKNARIHPQKQIDVLVKNIEKFGFTTPVLVDENNNVIAGHGRLLALEKLGKDEAPCVRVEGLTEEEVKALRLADNQIATMGEWDIKLAIEELKELSEEMQTLTGFDLDLLIEPDEKDDEIPENVPAQSKLGDLYELGKHRVLCGDSTKKEDVERLMDGKKADMVFTDPPYNVQFMSRKNKKHALDYTSEPYKDNRTDAEWTTFLNGAFENIDLNLRGGGVFYIWGADRTVISYYENDPESRFDWLFHKIIVWDKDWSFLNRKDLLAQNEFCIYGWKRGAERKFKRQNYSDIWKVKKTNPNNMVHSAQKPVELVNMALMMSSDESDIILDLFLGSGSTLIASEKTGRVCYGMELDPKYVDVIVQRYVEYTGNTTIKKNSQEIIWEKSQKQQEKSGMTKASSSKE